MAPDGVLQKVAASLRSVGEFDLAAISVTPTSSVYKAVERKLRRPLVIKLMPLSQWPNRAQISAMAGAERRIVKGFDFPNVPRLLTGGEVDDHLFWISEFVDGVPLSKTLEMGETFSALDLVDMARQLCNSVESTGKSGIVHHRFHPQNLIIEWDGGAKILDWGVPPYADFGPNPSPATLHSAHYLAPEQLSGPVGDLRSNLFNIAVILYHLATAQLPFTGETIKALKSSMESGAPPSPSKLNRKIPEGLSVPILKTLAANPDDRYQSAAEFLRDLENFKKYGVKEELPANFYSRPASTASPEPGSPNSSRPQFDSGLDLDNAWTPAVTARQTADIAVMSLQDATVAVAEKPPEPAPAPVEPPVPVKETVYCEPEAKPAAPPKPKIPLPKIKPPKITMKDVNKVANKIPPLTAALVLAGVVIVLFAWKFIIPTLITDKAPVTKLATDTTQAQSAQPEQPAVQPTPESAADSSAEEESSGPDVVVRTYDKSGHAKPVRKAKIKTLVLPPPPPTVGELAVNSDPAGASFILDGRSDPSFVTPFTVSQLVPGHHTVTFNKPGYQSQSLATDVTAGSRATIMTRLALQGGTLSIASTPSGAHIAIDGRDTGKTTPAQFIVIHGQHTVTLRFPGYLEASIPVAMADGQTHSISPDLIPMGRTVDIKTAKKGLFGMGRGDKDMGRVTIRTEPTGATVLVNGQAAPKTTPTEIMLNPGGYELIFQLPGYKTQKKVIVVDWGSKVTVTETLRAGQ
ncbi:MAG: serine/threonine-protein kinase [Terriglobia bacterium]|nr:serine/threonine-protein kinase [Terriglobia bacterium]